MSTANPAAGPAATWVQAFKSLLLLPLAVALSACPPPIYPGHKGDYDLVFAKSYVQRPGSREVSDRANLTLEQLYALHRIGRERFHHGAPKVFDEFARRTETPGFLRAKLEQAPNARAVDAILSLLRGLQRDGHFDPRRDPSYIALIQEAARRHDDKLALLRDSADEIERGADLPSTFGSLTRVPWEGRGDDYDDDFAKHYCPGCDYYETIAEADRLPMDQLYALQRFYWERDFPRNYNRYMARRGAAAAVFYKRKLAGKVSGEATWNMLATFELMRDLGTYDPAGDAELMRLAEAAAAKAGRWRKGIAEDTLERIRTGARHPHLKVEER